MYAPEQTVFNKTTRTPSYAYHERNQTHFLWTKKAIKEYPKIRSKYQINSVNTDGTKKYGKVKYTLFNPIATPEHITEAKLLLRKGYILPSTDMTKKERDYVQSYATREQIIYDIKKSLPNSWFDIKWKLRRYKHRTLRYFYAFIIRKEQPSFFS